MSSRHPVRRGGGGVLGAAGDRGGAGVAAGNVAASNLVMSIPGKDAMTDEQQIAALREEIRRDGRRCWILRLVTGGVLLAAALYALPNLAALYDGDGGGEGARVMVGGLLFLGVCAASLGLSLGGAWASGHLFRRTRATKHRLPLEVMPTARRAATLAPLLASDTPDTRMLAQSLLAGATTASEVAPAGPDARGNEASAAEGER